METQKISFNFSATISIICSILATLMLWASYWQYTRYTDKLVYIKELDARLKLPIQPLSELLNSGIPANQLIHRKVSLRGSWDYQHEIVLRNRKFQDSAGVFVFTPIRISNPENKAILVNRGFLPLSHSSRQIRQQYQNGPQQEFLAIIKEPSKRRFMAPKDEEAGPGKAWVDSWLRPDIAEISKQIPYPLLPLYLEILPDNHAELDSQKMLQTKSDKDQILFMPGNGVKLQSLENDMKDLKYPLPGYETFIPPGRHYKYIFEWATMALMTVAIGIILQLKRH